ncbi:Crp/Fnr family transcriptional regulator [Palleronia pelagia]|uniref:cAMP-binding domain of CRP or a regulatory subunit of cAMP-dependent protein kinases n=1 Tax=Palleronia pelagia TaxID=387096 RepID=A0A1H8FIQ9_9RHOB|nr:Crp/Fnr family transcriptional regulator [Palleronia pelagia]SEN31623.1 cAMP-binding domain of CRP or a regulatory subunit of cAMP-dependent protein kinases [Palleronia pelagia]
MIRIMSDLAALFAHAPLTRVRTGQAVFHRDDPIRDAIFLESGSIALVRTLSEGETLTLHVARPGTLLAEASLFAARYHCDANTRTDTALRRVARGAFLEGLAQSPATLLDLFAGAAKEVQAQRARVEILRMKRLPDRLDAWLTLNGAPGDQPWTEVAEAIGVSPAALYRELAKRRKAG